MGRPTKARGSGKRTPGQRAKKHRNGQVWLPKSLRERVQREARKLGLTPTQYLRMAVSISESVAAAMPTDQSMDMKTMAKIVESPIWGILVQSIGPTISGLLDGQSSGESKALQEKTETQQQEQREPRPGQPGQHPFSPPFFPPFFPPMPPIQQTPAAPARQPYGTPLGQGQGVQPLHPAQPGIPYRSSQNPRPYQEREFFL